MQSTESSSAPLAPVAQPTAVDAETQAQALATLNRGISSGWEHSTANSILQLGLTITSYDFPSQTGLSKNADCLTCRRELELTNFSTRLEPSAITAAPSSPVTGS